MMRIVQKTLLVASAICFLFGANLFAQDKAYKGAKKDLHIYLCIGQSNMAGRAPMNGEQKVIPNCFLLTKEGKWEPAKNPLNIHSTIRKGEGMQRMGPSYTFAKTMVEKSKGASIGLVVNAKGGSSIGQWATGTKFYKEAVRRTKEAQKTGTLKGIIWHQGESDAKRPDGYLDKMKALIENLRKDLDAPGLPFVAGQVNNVPKINEQIAKLPETVKSTAYVKSEGLKASDRWHFNAESVKLMGERYATKMLSLQGSKENK